MKSILITGFNGFVGRHACREFRARGYEIHGIGYGHVDDESAQLVDKYDLCDLSDPEQTSVLDMGEVDIVLNLAGYATNTGGDTGEVHRINIGAHINLYRRIMQLGLAPRVLAVSSGAVYDANQQMPETEESTLKDPNTARPYEASKILMERALEEFKDTPLNMIAVRPFNHIGPGQGPGFIVPDIAGKILVAQRDGGTVSTGNLQTLRDYTDVRDVVRAYADLADAESLPNSTYNICSGVSKMGSEILRLLLDAMDPEHNVRVEGVDASLIRANDASNVYGSYARLHADTGWEPRIPLEKTIADFVEWLYGHQRP